MSQLIAKRYAQALFEFAQNDKQTEKVNADLLELKELIQTSTNLKQFLNNDAVTRAVCQDTLKKIFKSKFSRHTYEFLLFLESKDRLNILDKICVEFEELFLDSTNTVHVKVDSTTKLAQTQMDQLKEQLSTKFKKNIQADCHVDHSLIGGFKFQINDVVYDYTIKSQLDKFKDKIIHA